MVAITQERKKNMIRRTIDLFVDYVEDVYIGLSIDDHDKREIIKLLEPMVNKKVRITIEVIDADNSEDI